MSDDTDVGGIVGHLRLDDSDWNATLDAAQAKARELGREDPTIRVNVDDAAAMSKLAEVQAAVDATGSRSVQISPDAIGAAQRVVDTRGDAASTAAAQQVLDMTASEGALAAATRESALAQASLAASTGDVDGAFAALDFALGAYVDALPVAVSSSAELAASEDAVAASTAAATDAIVGQTAAQAASAAATKVQSAAQDTSIEQWQKIAIGVGAVVTLSGPLAAAAVGVGGALVGMGAAGVLAVLGIQNAMSKGTATGNEYSAGIQSLKADLTELEGTAANDFLGSFQAGVAAINADMPQLNSEIGTFTGQLGSAADSALLGVIDALHTANPLLTEAGQYIDDVASGFEEWTADGGLQKFVAYAEQELPVVENAVSGLSDDVVELGSELGPLGNDVLDLVTDFSTLFGGLQDVQNEVGGFMKSLGPVGKIIEGVFNALPSSQLQNFVTSVIPGATSALNNLTGSQSNSTQAAYDNIQAQTQMQTAVQLVTKAENDQTAAQSNATAAAQKYASWVASQSNDALKQQQSLATLQGDYNNLATAVTSSMSQQDQANARSMTVSTSAGLQTHNMVLQGISDAEAEAQAVYTSTLEQTGSKQKAAAAFNASLASSDAALVTAAGKAGINQSAVQSLIDTIVKLPPTVSTVITVDDDKAKATLAAWAAEVNSAADQAALKMSEVPGGHVDTPSHPNGKAQGGAIMQHLASGGPSGMVSGPGTSTSDSIITALSNGEQVIKAQSAGYDRPFLTAYNANPGKALGSVAAAGAAAASRASAPAPQVHIHIDGTDLSKFIAVKIDEYDQQVYQQSLGGAV